MLVLLEQTRANDQNLPGKPEQTPGINQARIPRSQSADRHTLRIDFVIRKARETPGESLGFARGIFNKLKNNFKINDKIFGY